ncbi:hypothetical protein HDV03_001440 [Kappamyces sp. JEL0829]|nr:hypothetical protein HDV03_001440 [Kappamyces sp. JEL0829]
MVGYTVSSANEYLILTGYAITELSIKKKAFVLPGQRCTKMSLTPLNYTLSLHAMTVEKLEFLLPAVFTIGPLDEPNAIMRYARLLAGNQTDGVKHIQDIVTGIIEGETRVLAAKLTMEEIFKDRSFFKQHVAEAIQSELDQFGMKVYNSNIRQLQDSPGSEYFKYLRLKAQEAAINQAKVDVATAKTAGSVGEKKKEAEQRKNLIEIEAATVVYEQNRKIDIAKATTELDTEKTNFQNNVLIAQIEAEKKAAMRNAELQREVEVKNVLVQQEKERGKNLAKTIVEAEMIEALAKADLFKLRTKADAAFYTKQKEAEALQITYQAQANGIKYLQEAFGHDNASTLQYIMINQGVFQELAKSNAEAVKGMQPKISVWNTGDQSSGMDAGKPIRDIFQTLPPLFSTINEQTGLAPPAWMAMLPQNSPAAAAEPQSALIVQEPLKSARSN